MRILVTGASGFLGSHALPRLDAAGFEVHALHRAGASPAAGAFRWHAVDLFDAVAVAQLLGEIEPTHLLHLAWVTTPGLFWNSPDNERYREASRSLASEFARAGGRRMVAVGSGAEYDWRLGSCIENETPLRPLTPYSRAKDALRQQLAALAEDSDLEFAWARVFWPFGPREHPARLLPSVICALLRGEIASCSEGSQIRDFLYVSDVAEALCAVTESSVTGPINVGSGVGTSVRDLATLAGRQLGRVERIRFGARPTPAGEAPRVVADIARLQKEVGFSPQTRTEAGVEASVRWWAETLRLEAPIDRGAAP